MIKSGFTLAMALMAHFRWSRHDWDTVRVPSATTATSAPGHEPATKECTR